uniref:Uncharacterized protein n=1 Tax=viral metagenome TaxID=1070528 RepID=A0A6M3JH72_9ZZZZ
MRAERGNVVLDTDPHMFDTDDLLACDVQANLDLAIDNTAKRGRWKYNPPWLSELPGQIGIDNEN